MREERQTTFNWSSQAFAVASGFAIVVALLVVAGVLTWNPVPDTEPDFKVLRVGVTPDQNREALLERYSGLLSYLKAETGLPATIETPKSYSELLQWFQAKKVDLAFFGGLTFVIAETFHGAEPLVMRDVDTRFTSSFIVRADDPAKGPEDFKGRSFSFGSRLSAAAHLMPRHFLSTLRSIEAETYFREVRYSGTHDTSIYWVRDGAVDMAATDSEVVRTMFSDGSLKKSEVRVLWETPPYANYVWAVRSTLDTGLKTKLRDAFMALSQTDPRHADILRQMRTRSFLPAGSNDFRPLKRIAMARNMLQSGGGL